MRRITLEGKTFNVPDDATPEEINAISSQSKPLMISPDQGLSQPKAMKATNPWIRGGLNALPTAGGFAGGMIGAAGGPGGAIAGAGIGGSVGEGMKEGIGGEPFSAGRIAGEGGKQAFYELFGQGLARGAGKLAKPVMRRAFGVGKITPEFPNMVETALKEKVTPSVKGLGKAEGLRGASADALTKTLTDAASQGTTFKTSAVTKEVRAMLRDKAIPSDVKATVMKKLKGFMKDNGKTIDPLLLKEIKGYNQKMARAVYNAEGVPNQTFHSLAAKGAQNQLETIPGVAAQEARTQNLIGVTRGVEDVLKKPGRQWEFHKPDSWPFVRSVVTPGLEGKIAIALDHPTLQAALRHSPRAAAAILAQMLQQEPDATDVYP